MIITVEILCSIACAMIAVASYFGSQKGAAKKVGAEMGVLHASIDHTKKSIEQMRLEISDIRMQLFQFTSKNEARLAAGEEKFTALDRRLEMLEKRAS